MPMDPEPRHVFLGQAVQLACQWEVVAAKPGNVHRGADFEDLNLVDFLSSATAVGHFVGQEANRHLELGSMVLGMIRATRRLVNSNTNLGICLLFAPMVKAFHQLPEQSSGKPNVDSGALRESLQQTLDKATADDTQAIYQAIAMAQPGSLGTSKNSDVQHPESLTQADTPLHVMGLAEARDSIAHEYVTGFRITWELSLPTLTSLLHARYPLRWVVIGTFIHLLSEVPDTLIARKVGRDWANRIADHARTIRDSWWQTSVPDWPAFREQSEVAITAALQDLDFLLRSDGNRRNPGTTADLVAAGLLLAILTGVLPTNQSW